MIRTEVVEGTILVITMDRAPANAIDQGMSDGLDAAFSRFERETALLACVVTGSGERFFSAGWDLKEFVAGRDDESRFGSGGYMGLTERWDLVKPVIAAVNGTAAGGGFELALACDLVVAAEGARFILPEVRHGLVAEGGGAIRAPRRLPPMLAMELLLTGRPALAEELHRHGFVNRVVPPAQVLDAALELARAICAAAPTSIAATKEIVRRTAHLSVRDAYAEMRGGMLPAYRRMRDSANRTEGPRAFTEKRPPRWTG
ncbi:enoyl-CoA hydratase/isomerase family protein [Roseomonas aerophila]|uniref:Enoyl-CoA hydratase/isomerase family protein n=1 Tax=Teichococcus aerophilus TaxID=1224513 RepID=A0ABR7RKX9_9PROT|nr:enoyl-CoA hydratase-related protein [Pseudoroseomonas aerophila]MBC9206986.1 enoyl-CoA hydratase/isomerase family protein [Pseudoroseomonas aerophila]